MPLANPDGSLTEQGESILVRAFGRAFCAAPVREGETEQHADDEIVAHARALNADA